MLRLIWGPAALAGHCLGRLAVINTPVRFFAGTAVVLHMMAGH